jgi:hypothetical protein
MLIQNYINILSIVLPKTKTPLNATLMNLEKMLLFDTEQ